MQVPPDANSSSSRLKVAVALAPSIPGLLAFNLPPSPTLLNQCLAVALWGSVVWSLGAMSSTATAMQEARSLLAAAGVLVFGVLMSLAVGSLPAAIAVSTLLMLVVSALLVFAGSDLGRRADPTAAFSWFLLGMVGVGLLSAFIALIQVFAPELPDGQWIARSGMPGRAVGNLRQPNHLSSLLLWSYHRASWLCSSCADSDVGARRGALASC